ncbi:SP_0198 family lipoprotein [Streptococcus parasanguinis]|uniref:SP_0198 family lipoprotein n=1 Tax=Streptococcus parasanguinis TaxID=1318 RepID=UPI00066DD9FC|nr:SP_0198 family lipoprotein [Streptococcus parasanguinis]
MKKIMSILTLAVALFPTACSQQEKATQTSSSASSSSSETAASTSEKPEQGVSIDGSYRGQDEESTILLVVTGQKGTFTVQDADGEEETKEVSIDPVNQSMRIGDEPYRYRIEGDQLSLEDLEQAEDDQGIIVLTKQ